MRSLAAVLFGYLLASVTVVLIYQTATGGPFTHAALLSGLALTAAMALPGFVVLRGLMWGFRVEHLVCFGSAGALNGEVSLSLFFQRPMFDLYFGAMGLVAGMIYWLVERRVADGNLKRGRIIVGTE